MSVLELKDWKQFLSATVELLGMDMTSERLFFHQDQTSQKTDNGKQQELLFAFTEATLHDLIGMEVLDQ